MRESLKCLIKNTILFKYNLPNGDICRSKISTNEDSCYISNSNEDLAEIIYNAVIEYAFNEYEIKEFDFDVLHRRALISRLKFNHSLAESKQLKFGFFGEVILYCMLYIFHKAPPVIARGHLYQVLEKSETKGYDAYHLIDNKGEAELWFGEVKFYQRFTTATTGQNGAIKNLEKAISDDYLNSNLIAISERTNDLAFDDSVLKPILNDIKCNPEIKISELSKKHNIKLVYPILILFDGGRKEYDQIIKGCIAHIEKHTQEIDFNLSIDISLFFILSPVENSREIKSKVLKWIRDKKPLMS